MNSIKNHAPWWGKLGAKIALSRIRLPYSVWRRLGIFQHGTMLDPDYAIDIYMHHYNRCKHTLPTPYTVLELGPGDSLATAFVARANGAQRVYLVDAGLFASQEVATYRPLLEKLGHPWAALSGGDMQQLLDAASATYLTAGLESLKSLPPGSIDLVFSQAVLEHVWLHEFTAIMSEMFRVQRPGSLASHRIDFQDHLQHSLNSLRFSEERWESPLFSQSGFYTNRLRANQVVEIMQRCGYEVVFRQDSIWEKLPIDKKHLAPPFRTMSNEELCVLGMDIVVRKP